jgi:hypothetical protein
MLTNFYKKTKPYFGILLYFGILFPISYLVFTREIEDWVVNIKQNNITLIILAFGVYLRAYFVSSIYQ